MPHLGDDRRPLHRRVLLGSAYLVAGVAAGTLLAVLLHVGHPAAAAPAPSTNRTAQDAVLAKQPAADFTLTDQNGQKVTLSSFKGRVVLLTFLDPQCRLLCPVVGKDIGALERALPPSVQPELLLVSVAPGRTIADVQQFVSTEKPGWDPGWHWLLGPSDAALKLVWLQWHITVIPTAGDVTHDAVVDIIDPHGYLRAEFPAPVPIDDASHDVSEVAHA